MALAEDLEAIEKSIRRLQIEWDKFFGGLERKHPNDLKLRTEALLRQHANSEIRNNTDRFSYQTLTAKYNTLSELWAKRLRAKEEGKKRVIVFNLSGHGNFDLGAYEAYLGGKLQDYEYPAEKIAEALRDLPQVKST